MELEADNAGITEVLEKSKSWLHLLIFYADIRIMIMHDVWSPWRPAGVDQINYSVQDCPAGWKNLCLSQTCVRMKFISFFIIILYWDMILRLLYVECVQATVCFIEYIF